MFHNTVMCFRILLIDARAKIATSSASAYSIDKVHRHLNRHQMTQMHFHISCRAPYYPTPLFDGQEKSAL